MFYGLGFAHAWIFGVFWFFALGAVVFGGYWIIRLAVYHALQAHTKWLREDRHHVQAPMPPASGTPPQP